MVLTATTKQLDIKILVEISTGRKDAKEPTNTRTILLHASAHDDHITFNERDKTFLIIGRDPTLEKTNDIFIPDMTNTISHKHGYLIFKNNRLYYCDNDSKSGAKVNGKLVHGDGKCLALKPGKTNTITLGEWGSKAAARIFITTDEVVKQPQPLSHAELTVTYPGTTRPADLYRMDIMDNNYIALFHTGSIKERLLKAAKKIYVGRAVSKEEIRIAQIEDKTLQVSKHHGVFSAENGFLLYKDLGSRNGSFLDKEKLKPNSDTVISQGDHILGLGLREPGLSPVQIFITYVHKPHRANAIPFASERRVA